MTVLLLLLLLLLLLYCCYLGRDFVYFKCFAPVPSTVCSIYGLSPSQIAAVQFHYFLGYRRQKGQPKKFFIFLFHPLSIVP
jgi:hypothetical protein